MARNRKDVLFEESRGIELSKTSISAAGVSAWQSTCEQTI